MKIRKSFAGIVAVVAAAVGFGLASAPSTTLTSTSSSAATTKTDTVHQATLTSYAWICRTIYVSKSSYTYNPHMWVPVCYNGSQIWVNGGVTPGVSLIMYQNDGYTWYGTYNDSSHNWLGVGENMDISAGIGGIGWTISCDPRWYINANGQVYASSYGC